MVDYQTQKVIDDFFRKEKKEEKQKKQKAKYMGQSSPINRKQKKQKQKSKVR